MSEFDEVELERPAVPTPPPQPRWIRGLALLALVLALLAVWYYRRVASPTADHVYVDRQPVVAQPAAPSPAASDLPPLDQTDALVRDLVRALSSHPIIASWLTTDQLIRNFTVAVDNVAEGDTPARHLQTIKPAGPFQVRRLRESIVVDDRSYRRFDGHAAAVADLDPKGAAQLYRRLKPRLDDAYRERAGPTGDFDRTLRRAIVNLLETPIVEGPILVRPSPAGYDYADPALQSLSRAQQQLLRMGPQNARRIQQTLRAIALELGMAESALPQER
jgi:Protein of unknown function (DUF3014)